MSDSTTFVKKFKTKRELKDDSVFSKNYSKSMKYRLRVQQAKEAEELIKEFKDEQTNEDKRLY